MYDVIRKNHVTESLTWLKQHNYHYRNIENWCSLASDDGLSQILIQEGRPNANFVTGHDIKEQSTSQNMDNKNSSQSEVMQKFCKFYTNDVITHPESQCNNKEDNHYVDTTELDTELAEDQAAINQRQVMINR